MCACSTICGCIILCAKYGTYTRREFVPAVVAQTLRTFCAVQILFLQRVQTGEVFPGIDSIQPACRHTCLSPTLLRIRDLKL